MAMQWRKVVGPLLTGIQSRPLLRDVGRWLRPDLASPSAPLATVAWLDSFDESLMPRTSVLQGVVGGLSVLSARVVASGTERALEPVLGPHLALTRRLAVRAGVGAVGLALTRLPERGDERLWWSGLRGAGTMLQSVAVGGAIHDAGHTAWARQPAWDPDRAQVRAVVATTSVIAGVSLWAQRRLRRRNAAVDPWPIEQRNDLGRSAAVSVVVILSGRVIGKGIGATRGALRAWFEPGEGVHAVSKKVAADVVNLAAWSALAGVAYHLAVGRISDAFTVVERPYATPPDNPRVSGSVQSPSSFAFLGKQGRRFVVDVLDREVISRTMQESVVADPIRVYVGLGSQPLYPTARAELALEELQRTGAYDRGYLLLVSPTGTGWVDQTLVESAELLTRGDVATCAIQYGAFPSFLAVQKVALGRSQFRILLLGVRERLRAVPPERRPKVLVFGESLGAWTASDVVMHQGIAGFDHYGIDRALWVGMPWLAKWSRSGMIRSEAGSRHSTLVPPGSVGVFDSVTQLEGLDPAQRAKIRAVILSHDNDPVALLGPDLLLHRPRWLQTPDRGRGVPAGMHWTPVVTFLQTAVDALNSMIQVPGQFTSFGHDYRGDMARFVHGAFHLPDTSETQMRAVEQELVRLDLDRAARLSPPA